MGKAPAKIGTSSPLDPRVFYRDFVAERQGGRSGTAGWPIECIASGVNANQAPELRKFFRDAKINCEVSSDGNPVYTDATHQAKCLKARHLHHRNSFS